MGKRHTSATPAGVPRSRSKLTRRERKALAEQEWHITRAAMILDGYEPDEDDWDDHEYDPDDCCERCGGEGSIEYADAGPGVWGEDIPSEVNHPVECPECGGLGR